MNYEIERAIKALKNGVKPNFNTISDLKVRRVIKQFYYGGTPVIKTGNIDIDKKLRSINYEH